MKYVYIALFIPILFLSGVYAGLEWGLSAKPTIDLDKCKILTRYEDGSFDCDPDGLEVDAPPIPVMQNTQMQDSPNTVQNTQPASTLQPAGKE